MTILFTSARFAREPERRKVGGNALLTIEGTTHEAEPDMVGETVVLPWAWSTSNSLSNSRANAVTSGNFRSRDMKRLVSYPVAFLLRQSNHVMPVPLDLSRHPQAQIFDVRPHNLETYDELAHRCDEGPESKSPRTTGTYRRAGRGRANG
jgi:hypothetical protein